jgi:fructokinase
VRDVKNAAVNCDDSRLLRSLGVRSESIQTVPVVPCRGFRIGVDLGGTKIEIIALKADGSEAIRRRISTPAPDYEATVEALCGLVSTVEGELGKRSTVGIGTPGAVDPSTTLLKNSNSTMLNGRPLKSDIESRLGREVRVANDANCFALSEAIDGAGAGYRNVFGVILGTGVGGGIVIDQDFLVGRNASAGEWGHNPLPWRTIDEEPGPLCYCGNRGCIETFLSGPGLANDFERTSRRVMTPAAIAAAAALGDDDAAAAMTRYKDRLARGIASVVNIVDPDIIVLGGGLSNISALYDDVPPLLLRHIFSKPGGVTVVRALHGDSSGVRGAARLWPWKD